MVPVPVPASYLDHKKQIFQTKFGNFFFFLHSKLFYKEKVFKFRQIYCKMWMKKMLNEGNQILNFISSSGSETVINYGSDFLTSYGSGSTSQKVRVSTVPVPQRWLCHTNTAGDGRMTGLAGAWEGRARTLWRVFSWPGLRVGSGSRPHHSVSTTLVIGTCGMFCHTITNLAADGRMTGLAGAWAGRGRTLWRAVSSRTVPCSRRTPAPLPASASPPARALPLHSQRIPIQVG